MHAVLRIPENPSAVRPENVDEWWPGHQTVKVSGMASPGLCHVQSPDGHGGRSGIARDGVGPVEDSEWPPSRASRFDRSCSLGPP